MFLFSILLNTTSSTHNQIYGYFYGKTLTIHTEKHESRLQTALHQFSTSFVIKIVHFSEHLGFGRWKSAIVDLPFLNNHRLNIAFFSSQGPNSHVNVESPTLAPPYVYTNGIGAGATQNLLHGAFLLPSRSCALCSAKPAGSPLLRMSSMKKTPLFSWLCLKLSQVPRCSLLPQLHPPKGSLLPV